MKTQSAEVFKKYTTPETFARIKETPSVAAMWAECVKQYAGDVAIVDDGKEYAFADIERDAALLRTAIAAASDAPRVALLAANSYDFVKAFIAITTLGRAAVILPPQLDAPTVFGCCMKYGAGLLIYQPALAERTAVAEGKVALLATDAAGGTPTPAVEVPAEAACCVMFTGGTTGRSKGALLSNGAVMQGVVNGCYGYKDVFGQRYMLVLPLSHVFGLIRNLLTSLYTGSALFINRSTKDMFRDIAAFKPTIFVLVPALAEMALNLSRQFGRNMLGEDMKYIIAGAAAVSPYLVAEYKKLGIDLFPGYGLTESANLVSGNPESMSKPDSVGIPYPNQELRIENGELWLKGANMMDGYIGEDEADAYCDGWFKTGDLVRLDDEGFLYITGRVKEIIVLPSGENVSPAEVEAKFNELPFIQDCQVFEDLTESGAHILALEVVPRATELGGIEKDKVGAFITAELEKVNAALPSFERVNRIVIRTSDFERTPSMKIVRYHKV